MHAVEVLGGLRDDLAVVGRVGLAQVDGDDPPARGRQVRVEIEYRAVVADEVVLVVEVVDQIDGLAIRRLEVLVGHAVAAVGAFPGRDDHVLAVFADGSAETPVGVVGPLVDDLVLRLRRAHLVEAQLGVEDQALELLTLLRLGIADVEKALAIRRPVGVGELGPLQLVGELFAGGGFQHAPRHPVGARLAHAISDEL